MSSNGLAATPAESLGHGRCQQLGDLRPQLVLDRLQQPGLADLGQRPARSASRPGPSPSPTGWAVRRPSPRRRCRATGWAGSRRSCGGRKAVPLMTAPPPRRRPRSSSVTAATKLGSASSPPSWKIRPTFGSTSRSEFRQVKSSQGSRPGRCRRPTVMPSRSSS